MDGGDDPGMSVAGVRDRDAGAEIEVAGAVDVPDPRALGVVGHHWEVRREHRRDDGVVALRPPGACRRGHCGHGCPPSRSEEQTSELQSLMRISYAVFCLKKKTNEKQHRRNTMKHTTEQHTH